MDKLTDKLINMNLEKYKQLRLIKNCIKSFLYLLGSVLLMTIVIWWIF